MVREAKKGHAANLKKVRISSTMVRQYIILSIPNMSISGSKNLFLISNR